MGAPVTQPIINIGGSKFKGTDHLKSSGNRIAPVARVVIDGDEQQPAQISYEQQFDQWLDSCRNKQAPAIDESDYQAVAERWGIDVAWVKAVFAVESAQESFNPDGTTKSLYERHVLRKQVLASGLDKATIAAIKKRLGGNLYSMRPGGYKGGVAEWQRTKEACCGISAETKDFAFSLNVALSAPSFGGPQILGKWAVPLLGYESPSKMVEAFHQNEDAHLSGFVAFVEKNGLVKHLQAANKAKDPYKHIVKFAKGYNGKWCCDKNGKRKNYAAEILRQYRAISGQQEKFDSLIHSRTQQGNVISIFGKGSAGYMLLQALGIDVSDLSSLNPTQVVDKVKDALATAKGMTAQVTELAEQNADLISALQDQKTMMLYMAGILALSVGGNLYSMYGRWQDRRRGYK